MQVCNIQLLFQQYYKNQYFFLLSLSLCRQTHYPSALHFSFPRLCSHLYIGLLIAGSPPLDHNINASYPTTVVATLEPKPQPLKNMPRPFMEVAPPGSKMPPLENFRLTKELVEKRVKDNVIVVTFGNYAFMDFILTWVKHLTDLHVDNILVGKSSMSDLLHFWKINSFHAIVIQYLD